MAFLTQDQIKGTNVLEVANQFAGGTYKWENNSGSPLTITHKGTNVIVKQPAGTYCSGFTSAMAIIIAKNRGLLEDKSISQVKEIIRKINQGEMYSKLIVNALVGANIGKEINLEDAQAGDFVQIWRTNASGHSAIFIQHIKSNNKIIGIKYRSTQTSTNGIGDYQEYFSDTSSLAPTGSFRIMSRNQTYFVRLNESNQPEETTTTTTTLPISTVGATSSVDNNVNLPPQESGRQERTSESPNSSPKNQTAAPPGISNIFKNTYNPEPIKVDLLTDSSSKQEFASNTGFLPFVWYNTYQISYGDISYFQLSTDGLMPVVKIIFSDSANLMKDKGMPLDDSKIKIFLNPRNKNLKPILLEFKITVFKVNGANYTLAGVLDINQLYVKQFKSYKSSTSYQSLQLIFREMGLGFNTNIDDTNDSMTWINTGERVYNFVNSILETSYKSDESFLLGYIDYYYHFNYVDIEKELNRNLKEELGISSFGLEEAAQIKDKDKLASLFLTNDKTRENSNCYISNYKIINNSTNISILEGYLTKVKYYDDINKDLLVFDVDSITTQGDKIILKGAPQNEEFFNSNINLKYLGKLDIDNTHKNYNYSYIQNIRNITDLQKISLMVELSTPNYNIYRFQKIQVVITNTPTPSQTGINSRLSGEWFIVDIKFEMSRGRFYQKVQLVKRDLELSPEELSSESNSEMSQSQTPSVAKTNNSVENTTNPTDLKNTDVEPIQDETTNSVTTTTTISVFINQTEVVGSQTNETTTTTTLLSGPSYTFSITNSNNGYLAKIYNNGRLIDIQNYSSVTFTPEKIKKELTFNAKNFGFIDSVGGTGLNPPQPNIV